MISYVDLGALVFGGAFLAGLAWFAYRAGRNRAAVASAETTADEATAATNRAEAMTRAQVSEPADTQVLLDRLEQGDA